MQLTQPTSAEILPQDAAKRRVAVTYELLDDVETLAVIPKALLFGVPPDCPGATASTWLLYVHCLETNKTRVLLQSKVRSWRPIGEDSSG